jgi:hypothetical protein
MRYEMTMTVRGGERSLVWSDGRLSGDDEVRGRLQRMADDGRYEPGDLLSTIRAIEAVVAQQVTIVNLDLVEDGSFDALGDVLPTCRERSSSAEVSHPVTDRSLSSVS